MIIITIRIIRIITFAYYSYVLVLCLEVIVPKDISSARGAQHARLMVASLSWDDF